MGAIFLTSCLPIYAQHSHNVSCRSTTSTAGPIINNESIYHCHSSDYHHDSGDTSVSQNSLRSISFAAGTVHSSHVAIIAVIVVYHGSNIVVDARVWARQPTELRGYFALYHICRSFFYSTNITYAVSYIYTIWRFISYCTEYGVESVAVVYLGVQPQDRHISFPLSAAISNGYGVMSGR